MRELRLFQGYDLLDARQYIHAYPHINKKQPDI